MKAGRKKITAIFDQITMKEFFISGEPQIISLKPTAEAESAVDPRMDPTNWTSANALSLLVFMQLYK